jgi:hypothetical protein
LFVFILDSNLEDSEGTGAIGVARAFIVVRELDKSFMESRKSLIVFSDLNSDISTLPVAPVLRRLLKDDPGGLSIDGDCSTCPVLCLRPDEVEGENTVSAVTSVCSCLTWPLLRLRAGRPDGDCTACPLILDAPFSLQSTTSSFEISTIIPGGRHFSRWPVLRLRGDSV